MSCELHARSSVRRGGFTLVELMVVAAVIVCLLVVTVPALKSMVNSGQQAQSVNVLRSMLLVLRDYALTHGAVAGARFQDDGRIVPIYATNAAQHDVANYRTCNSGLMPGQPGTPFLMRAIEGMPPGNMPGSYRVIPLDYTYNGAWTPSPNWFTGQKWFLTSVLLFSSRGRAIQAQVQFPTGWAPSSGDATTSYSKWMAPTTYSFQGFYGGSHLMTGPSVTTDFRVYDYGAVQAYLSQAAQGPGTTVNPQYDVPYTNYPPNQQLTEAYRLIEETGSDFIINSNTGRLIRKGADLASEQ